MNVLRISTGLLSLPILAATGQMMNTGGNRPSVSPDGRYIAYSAARNGTWDIYVIRPDGSGEQRITSVREANFVNLGPPTWIGNRVAVWRRDNDTTRMFVVDLPAADQRVAAPAGASAAPQLLPHLRLSIHRGLRMDAALRSLLGTALLMGKSPSSTRMAPVTGC